MKNKFVLLNILLVLALFSAACAAQEATQTSGAVTALPSSAPSSTPGSSAPTDETGEAAITPTGAAATAAPAQGTEEGALIPQTGPGDAGLPDDLDEVMRVLNETGATLELGDAVQQDYLSVPGQILTINGEEVEIYAYNSAEDVEIQISQLPQNDPESEPHFYRLGSMLVRYAGADPAVRDLLENVLGASAAGQ